MGKKMYHKESSQHVTKTVLIPVFGPSSSEIKLTEYYKYIQTKLVEQTARNDE